MVAFEHILPMDIEKESFRIIGAELSRRHIVLSDDKADIVMRVIHTTADFDYALTLAFSEGFFEKARSVLENSPHIVTDTNMALSGINKKSLSKLGGKGHCFMADDDVAKKAKDNSVTRAYVSMEKAFSEKAASFPDAPLVFAVGNAPTALLSLCNLMQKGFLPQVVIGVPVGFVNVEASKELLEQMCTEHGVPFIINKGLKGGSTVAAAICNALLYKTLGSRD
ncbi:MAG: precorrin-8X methylmutase [Treponema sp.]|nr:precorrin-8X methylmutase [Treponema sp.]